LGFVGPDASLAAMEGRVVLLNSNPLAETHVPTFPGIQIAQYHRLFRGVSPPIMHTAKANIPYARTNELNFIQLQLQVEVDNH
jgi:hypothetical protein